MPILISFALGGVVMEWMYGLVGYVRLLGVAHLVACGPVWVRILRCRKAIGTETESLYGKYIHAYLVIAGICLLIEVIALGRYFLEDAAYLHRWG